jgi:(p)ppGpp synthase/HD superfamily hydrolase
MTMSLEQRAKEFATRSHEGQVRKYTGEPYINHPANVVEIVRSVEHSEEMLAAAWLHDVVEDCGIPASTIHLNFGLGVHLLVDDLTDVSKPRHGNRKARKALDLAHTAQAHPMAKTIKLADLIDNTGSIVKYDPDFAKVYLREKAALLEVLKEGDPTLWERANEIVSG